MKKTKLLVIALTATALTLGGAALAGCSKPWQSSAEGHWKAEDKSDLANHIDEDHNGYCDICNFEIPKTPDPGPEPGDDDDDDDGEDAEGVYTITLDAGEGTLDGATAVYKTTADGVIDLKGEEYLPEPECPAHYLFDNWYDEDGNVVDEKTAVFTKNTTLTARYVRDNGLWIGSEFKAELVLNQGCETHTQYWLGGKKITLDEGDVLSLYLNGELMTYTVNQGSTQIEVPDASAKVTSVTVSADALFVLYLNNYADEGSEPDWQVEYTGAALDIALTNKIPEGCERIEIPVGNGTVMLNIVAPDGTPINSENAADYQVHAWDGATNLYGDWNNNPTLADDLSIEYDMDLSINWIIHWAGGQSKAFASIIPDKEYVIKLVANNGSGDCYVKIYDPTAPDEPEEVAPAPKFIEGGAYIMGDFNNVGFNLSSAQYVDPEVGVKVTLTVGNIYKIVFCKNDAPDWNTAPTYEMAAGKEEGFLKLPVGTANGTVKVTGEYTITLVQDGDNVKFVFTPDENLEADLTVTCYDGCIVGQDLTVGGYELTNANGGWTKHDYCIVDKENGLTVELTENSKFKVVAIVNGSISWDEFTTNYCVLKGGSFGYDNDGNLTVSTAGTYKITVEYDENGVPTFTFELLSAADGGDDSETTDPDEGGETTDPAPEEGDEGGETGGDDSGESEEV